MPTLLLLRHGQSTANADGRFTGWTDVPLTARGERDAHAAGVLLAEARLLPEVVHTSVLQRSIRSADIVLDVLDRSWLPVHRSWRLNERQYGALTGRVKREVRQEAGRERYQAWRRSVHALPGPSTDDDIARLRADPRYTGLDASALPPVESFADLTARVLPYWTDVLVPQLLAGSTVLVVAHGNPLRSLITLIDRLDDQAVERLNVPTGAPLHYELAADLRPIHAGGRYLDPEAASSAALAVAAEGHD